MQPECDVDSVLLKKDLLEFGSDQIDIGNLLAIFVHEASHEYSGKSQERIHPYLQ